MTDFHYMKLQHSESIIAQMAATVFAALVQKQELGRQSEDELVERSVNIAIKLAELTESRVKSDEEWQRKDSSSSYLIG